MFILAAQKNRDKKESQPIIGKKNVNHVWMCPQNWTAKGGVRAVREEVDVHV